MSVQAPSPPAPAPVDPDRLRGLRRYNAAAMLVHAAQAVLILLLATDFALPVTASYLQGPPGSTGTETVTLFDTAGARRGALLRPQRSRAPVVVAPPGFAAAPATWPVGATSRAGSSTRSRRR
jgi:hypothetical protein